jgi:hypothetical protein
MSEEEGEAWLQNIKEGCSGVGKTCVANVVQHENQLGVKRGP